MSDCPLLVDNIADTDGLDAIPVMEDYVVKQAEAVCSLLRLVTLIVHTNLPGLPPIKFFVRLCLSRAM